jgi:6-phosphogluconolactonase
MFKKAAAVLLVCACTAMWVSCVQSSSTYLYAALSQSDQIVAYREDPNSGILTALTVSPIQAGPGVESLAIHPSKKFLYASNSGENDISEFVFGGDGGLGEITPRTLAGTAPTWLAVDSTGSYLCVANSGSDDIGLYTIDAKTGVPTFKASFPTGLSPLNMQLSPKGNFLYVSLASPQAGAPGSIEVLRINPAAASPFTFVQMAQTGSTPFGLAISPNGSYLYTSNFTDNTISGFAISSNGSLKQISGSPIGQSQQYSNPVAVLVDNASKYLFVANEQSAGNLSGYQIKSGGGLGIVLTSPFPANPQPNFLAIDPGGRYVFAGNQGSGGKIESFTLDPGSGTLTPVASYGVGNTPTSIVLK